jgi:tRNA threonylcarbamoyladenosine biosynthesis protein TsaE
MTADAVDLAAFEAAGERLGRELPSHSVVWLEGPLGAGKTTLVRAIARGRGAIEPVTSPTFGLVHHYTGRNGAIYHLDCYRLRHPDEAADLDWETLLAADLVLIEWPERAGAWAPPPSVRARIAHAGDDTRALALA